MKQIIKVLLSFTIFGTSLHAWQAPYDIGIKSKLGSTGYFTMPSMQIDFAFDGFNNNKDKTTLQAVTFGKKEIELQDLFLVSKLAKKGCTSFGIDDYVTLLATTTASFELEERRVTTAAQFSLTGLAFGSLAIATLEVRIPFELCEHSIISHFYGDGIANSIVADISNFDANSPVFFFVRNISVESYVKEEILDPKGLRLLHSHRSVGLGAIRITAALDFQDCFVSRVNKLQGGIVAFLDAPQSDTTNIIWPATRGLGGNYLGFVGEAEFELNKVMMPYLQIEAIKSFAQHVRMRVPQQKSGIGDARKLFDHGLKASKDMVGVTIQRSYSEYDTTIPYFADNAYEFSRTLGASVRFNAGNRVILADRCMLESWYALHYKFADVVEACESTPEGPFNYATVTEPTRNMSHSFGSRVSYALGNDIFINLGSIYTVRGKNAPRYNSIFVSLESAF